MTDELETQEGELRFCWSLSTCVNPLVSNTLQIEMFIYFSIVGLRFHEDVMQCLECLDMFSGFAQFHLAAFSKHAQMCRFQGEAWHATFGQAARLQAQPFAELLEARERIGKVIAGYERVPSKDDKMDGLACSEEWIAYPGPLPILGILFSFTEGWKRIPQPALVLSPRGIKKPGRWAWPCAAPGASYQQFVVTHASAGLCLCSTPQFKVYPSFWRSLKQISL